MKNYIYYIGADSALQKQITWDSVEDVIKCVRSAIQFGVVPGCQLLIARILAEIIEDLTSPKASGDNALKVNIALIMLEACRNVYMRVLTGPDGTGIIKTIPGWDKIFQEYTKVMTASKASPIPDADNEKKVKEVIEKVDTLTIQANDKLNLIFDKSIQDMVVYDLESLNFSDKIITSAETDIMVLTAASELVKILISGNQCIFIDAEINGSHQENLDD